MELRKDWNEIGSHQPIEDNGSQGQRREQEEDREAQTQETIEIDTKLLITKTGEKKGEDE